MTDHRSGSTVPAGFIALHGNRTETLLDTVAAWIAQHPLGALEAEIILVQSNGMAEWVKMALARSAGVCAAVQVQLPARFLWQTYRQVLGRELLPSRSPLDKTALAWRLMRLLPEVLGEEGFEPIAAYLEPGDAGRRFQLALRIADLFDQYQVYRPDWLDAWAAGSETLRNPLGSDAALAPEQRWQPRLWRRVMDELAPQQRSLTRSQLHRRVLEALAATDSESGGLPALPRRVILFGMTHVPLPTLELLAALSQHCQVILAIPNPCRFHWADIMDGRELLQIARRRLPLRNAVALHDVSLDAMHLNAHPLLAAWGRQARDFVRQLDAFDDAAATRQRFPAARIDLFDEDSPADASLLRQVQDHIRDLLPLSEHPRPAIADSDHSIVFHLAHSPVRELEILHDQLLTLLADPPGGAALQPRDIVVMVPAIDDFAPAIRAVFGQYGRHDPRHIPFDIADLSARASSPLMAAVQWLLRLGQDRCRLSALRGLLDVPAIAARFAIPADGLPLLSQWMSGAGIRWGLDQAHRDDLGLAACGEQNTARFGLRRMLMGYAVGRSTTALDEAFAGIEPYAEVGGLDAELAGGFARLVERLRRWQRDSRLPATPAQWAQRLRSLLADLVLPTEEGDRQTLAALDKALALWLDACDSAGFEQEIPLAVAGEAWLEALETPALNRRFRAGGVTFCTLMPMRAIPFEVVCLLGMNDGDYPRRSIRSDFDLMALPGQQRPGDRARRDDDRQLMLEALLSARRVLYLSWTARSVRDNAEQPPSALVAQLRDYLAAGWSAAVVAARSFEHPLQPFSRRYFEPGSALLTHAREWRAAHRDPAAAAHHHDADTAAPPPLPSLPASEAGTTAMLDLSRLARFLRNPVKAFFQQRLDVIFDDDDQTLPDEEAFGLDELEHYQFIDELAQALLAELAVLPPGELPGFALDAALARHLGRIAHSGRLPMAGVGAHIQAELEATLLPMLRAWVQARSAHPLEAPRRPLRFEHQGVVLEDWLEQRIGIAADADAGERSEPIWLALSAVKLIEDPKTARARPRALLASWLQCLLAAACGAPGAGLLIGRDATAHIAAIDADSATRILATLLEAWQQGMSEPLPVAARTALAFVAANSKPAKVVETYEGSEHHHGEVADACLARCYPDFAALSADGRFESLATRLYAPLADWVASQVTLIPHADAAENDDSAEAA